MFVGDLGERMQVVRFVILFVDMLLGDLVIVSSMNTPTYLGPPGC